MARQIVILDPNGVEVAVGTKGPKNLLWRRVAEDTLSELLAVLVCTEKLGTYTVTVREV